MRRIGNLSIGKRLMLGFGLVIALSAVAFVASLVASSNQAAISNRIVNHLDPARLAARDIVTLVRSIDDDGAFHFIGGADIATAAQPESAPTARVRSTLTIAEDRQTMHALWERSENGTTWQPWMDVTFTRSEEHEHH